MTAQEKFFGHRSGRTILERPGLKYRCAQRYIYFARARDGWIKIGTTNDLRRRLAELRNYTPGGVQLLLTLDGNYHTEAAIHSRFPQYRKNGEWFEPSKPLLEFIETCADV